MTNTDDTFTFSELNAALVTEGANPFLADRLSDPDSVISTLVSAAVEATSVEDEAALMVEALSFAAGSNIRNNINRDDFLLYAGLAYDEMDGFFAAFEAVDGPSEAQDTVAA